MMQTLTKPTLGQLIDRYTIAEARHGIDGLHFDVADEITVFLMAECGLSREQVKVLGEAI